MNPTPVTIIGAGWAGLAAAVTLSAAGVPVRVLEAAKHIGGRARSVQLGDTEVDNGQHLMIGAYRELLALLEQMGVQENRVLARMPQQLHVVDASGRDDGFQMTLPRLPAPLHLLFGMLNSKPLNLGDKLRTLLRFDKLLNTPLHEDCSVDHWLAQAQLPTAYVDNLLKPLCLAALTTHSRQASAKIFQNVLLQTFKGARANTDLLIPARNLGQVFPQQARDFIVAHGGQVLTEQRVDRLFADEQKINAIQVNGETLGVDQLILATAPVAAQRLLADVTACSAIADNIGQLEYEAITTVYLQYAQQQRLQPPMLGLLNADAEWLFDRRICGQPGLIAAVISAPARDASDQDTLGPRIAAQLSEHLGWPAPLHHRVITEKRATLRCTPDVDKIRPGIQTALANLRLCGDYVHSEPADRPGLPSTLEAALRCGVECARQLLKEKR